MNAGADTPLDQRPSALGPFRQPVFRNIWLTGAVSNLGGMIQTVGAAWLMITLGHSANMVAFVQVATALPFILFSLLAGAVADNFDRRLVMLWSQIFMLVVSSLLALFAWEGWINAPILLAFTFLLGVGIAFNGPAWQASVADMVPRRDLASAVALNSAGFNIARSGGPAIGGAVVAIGGAASAFALNAVSYFGLIVVLARWRPRRAERQLPRERIWPAMRSGLRFAILSSTIRKVLLRGGLFGLGSSATVALMPLIARDLLGGGAIAYGLLLGAFGMGAVLAALLGGRLRGRLSSEALLLWSSAVFSAATVGSAVCTSVPPAMIMLALAGGAWLIALSTFNVTIQMLTPPWVVARVLALYQMTAFGGIALGSGLWGMVAAFEGIRAALVGSALVMLAGVILSRRFALPPAEQVDLDPLRLFSEPETAVDIGQESGPVVVSIAYRILERDHDEFLAAISDWGRLRSGYGALHWSLQRDLHDPELWFERYESATWLDYLRHNQRFTKADSDAAARLRALHRGPAPPRVSRALKWDLAPKPHGA